MESAKHKLSTRGSILFQSYIRAKYMQVQFLPDIVIYWYAIVTVYKLDHTCLKVNQSSAHSEYHTVNLIILQQNKLL